LGYFVSDVILNRSRAAAKDPYDEANKCIFYGILRHEVYPERSRRTPQKDISSGWFEKLIFKRVMERCDVRTFVRRSVY